MARASLHAIGVAVVVGPGSVQVCNQSVAMYISTARASSSSTVYPLVKLTLEAVAFSASAVLPFSTLQLKVSCMPSNQVLQQRY